MSEEVKEVKPGYKTTEFYLTALAMVVGLALASGLIGEGTHAEKIVGFVVSTLNALGYSVSRGIAKK